MNGTRRSLALSEAHRLQATIRVRMEPRTQSARWYVFLLHDFLTIGALAVAVVLTVAGFFAVRKDASSAV